MTVWAEVQRQQEQHTGPRQGVFIKTQAVLGRTRAFRAWPGRPKPALGPLWLERLHNIH